jgi:hypothetical protein
MIKQQQKQDPIVDSRAGGWGGGGVVAKGETNIQEKEEKKFRNTKNS